MVKKKIQTGQITIAATAVAGIYEVDIVKLNEAYNKVTGIEVHQIHASGQSYYRLGFKDNSGEIITLVHVDSFKSSSTVPPDKKAKSIEFPANNQTLKAIIELPAANDSTNIFRIDFAIHLEYDPNFVGKC